MRNLLFKLLEQPLKRLRPKMMNKLQSNKLLGAIFILIALTGCKEDKSQILQGLRLGEFGAFYTRINSGDEFEKYARVREHPDIAIDLGKNNLTFVFWRGASYLPFLETNEGRFYVDEVVEREGDGSKRMPDRTNSYSVVKLIESSDEEVVVHWRYLPKFTGGNPIMGVAADKFVDEYFFIGKDGTIKRTIQKGTPKIDDWRENKTLIVQELQWSAKGIEKLSEDKKVVSGNESTLQTNPIIESKSLKPILSWKFDEATGENVSESISGSSQWVEGHKALWRKGVSGTALQFDGYYSEINYPADEVPEISNEITIDAWLAIGAYPWSFVPIIQQMDDNPEEIIAKKGSEAFLVGEEGREQFEEELENEGDEEAFDFVLAPEDDRGFFLGLDGYGNPSFKLSVGDTWYQLTADFTLERRQWYYLAATYAAEDGTMRLYIDGKLVGKKQVDAGTIELSTKDIRIGKGKERRPIRPVRDNTFPDSYSFDGLIDEIRVFDKALTANEIAEKYNTYQQNQSRYAAVDMDKRLLPNGEERDEFGAYYSHLKFYDVWDNLWRFSDHPDVVVEFDQNPSKFIFWRGTGYIPMMVNEKGQWYSNEFNETWNKSGGEGCMEPMSDKEAFTNHARIIENTPARVVVHWRYPLLDVNRVMANYDERTGWCDWSDWYYYIYPDGIAVKDMHLWTHGERNHEWQESMAIFGPDQHPEEIINTKGALSMLNLKGDIATYDWVGSPPKDVSQPEGQCIQYVNYTGEYKPVTIGDFIESDVYSGELTPYAAFPTWNHWPVSQMPSDGRYAIYPDRTAHSSLTHVPPSVYKEELDGPTPFYKKLLMEGMLNKEPEDIVSLARSWMTAPEITEISGAIGEYDPAQRAYVMESKGEKIRFTINASTNQPVVNLVFVIKNWPKNKKATVKIDDLDIRPRQGDVRDIDGSNSRILWMEFSANEKIEGAIY